MTQPCSTKFHTNLVALPSQSPSAILRWAAHRRLSSRRNASTTKSNRSSRSTFFFPQPQPIQSWVETCGIKKWRRRLHRERTRSIRFFSFNDHGPCPMWGFVLIGNPCRRFNGLSSPGRINFDLSYEHHSGSVTTEINLNLPWGFVCQHVEKRENLQLKCACSDCVRTAKRPTDRTWCAFGWLARNSFEKWECFKEKSSMSRKWFMVSFLKRKNQSGM